MSFQNKVVLVIGASSGIGAATAILFSSQGANVVLVGRNDTRLNEVANKCQDTYVITADISKDDEAKMIIEETVIKFTKIDVLVNNVGIVKHVSILDDNVTEIYDEIMSTNLRAVINNTKATIPYLIATNRNIVNISSVAGISIPSPKLLIYSISKAGLDNLTKGIALEMAEYGVRANAISPGPVKTEILKNAGDMTSWDDVAEGATLLKRVSEPEEISELVLYLAGEKAKGITGASFVNDNGMLLKN